jgi:transcription antitermination factor NusG
MATNPSCARDASLLIGADRFDDVLWYVTCTSPRHEKRVAEQLQQRGIASFLPLYASVRRWKDRRTVLDLPLFPGYVFVQINSQYRLDVLRLPSVIGLICFQGKPAPVEFTEIQNLRHSLSGRACVQPHPYLKAGRKVRIRSGPMAGVEGIFIRKKDRTRVVISISLIQRSVAAEIDEADVEPIA